MTVSVIQGVQVLLSEYAAIRPGDHCVITYTPDSREPAAWVAVGLKTRGITPKMVMMRPLVDEEFAERLKAVLPEPEQVAGRLVIFTLEKDTMSHFEPLKWVLERFGNEKCQILRVISASSEFFTEAMNLSPRELTGLNSSLLFQLNGQHSLHVSTEGGTDLRIEVDEQRFDWISNRGVWRPGGFTILPAGEIATFPVTVDGTLVADGAINCNIISRLDMRLAAAPLTVEIEGGKAVSFHSANPEIKELVGLCFARPHGMNIGELGFGTNSGISRFIPHNSHINERRCGLHLGFGQHNQPRSRVNYQTDIHLDLITNGAVVEVLGEDRTIDLNAVVPSDQPHPKSTRDEDIVEDCCGFGYGQLQSKCDLSQFAPPAPAAQRD